MNDQESMVENAVQRAPDVNVFKGDGTGVSLSNYWQTRPLVLNFLRHFGCQFCREFVTKLRQAYPDFITRGASIVVVAQGSPAQAAHFARIYHVPFPVLADPSRAAYAAFGLAEGSFSQTFNPTIAMHMVGRAFKGHLPGVSEHVNGLLNRGISLKQFGGTYIIDPGGSLRYAHIASPVYSVPAIEELLAALDS